MHCALDSTRSPARQFSVAGRGAAGHPGQPPVTVAWSIVAGLAAQLAAPPAAPGPDMPTPLDFRWDGPPACPSPAVVRAQIDALLDATPGSSRGEGMQVHARAHRDSDGTWTATTQLSTPAGELTRTIPGGLDCAEVAHAVAVIVAITIDPAARTAAPGPASTEGDPPPVPLPEVSLVPPTEPTEPDPTTTPRPESHNSADMPARRTVPIPLHGIAGAQVAVGWGHLPGVSGSLGVHAGIVLPRARFTATGQYWFRRDQPVRSGGVEFRQWSIAVRGCPVFPVRSRVDLLACGGLELGQTTVRTRGIASTANPTDLWAAWLLHAGVLIQPRRRLAIRLGPELFGPFRPIEYSVQPVGTVFKTSVVAVRGLITVEARFP